MMAMVSAVLQTMSHKKNDILVLEINKFHYLLNQKQVARAIRFN